MESLSIKKRAFFTSEVNEVGNESESMYKKKKCNVAEEKVHNTNTTTTIFVGGKAISCDLLLLCRYSTYFQRIVKLKYKESNDIFHERNKEDISPWFPKVPIIIDNRSPRLFRIILCILEGFFKGNNCELEIIPYDDKLAYLISNELKFYEIECYQVHINQKTHFVSNSHFIILYNEDTSLLSNRKLCELEFSSRFLIASNDNINTRAYSINEQASAMKEIELILREINKDEIFQVSSAEIESGSVPLELCSDEFVSHPSSPPSSPSSILKDSFNFDLDTFTYESFISDINPKNTSFSGDDDGSDDSWSIDLSDSSNLSCIWPLDSSTEISSPTGSIIEDTNSCQSPSLFCEDDIISDPKFDVITTIGQSVIEEVIQMTEEIQLKADTNLLLPSPPPELNDAFNKEDSNICDINLIDSDTNLFDTSASEDEIEFYREDNTRFYDSHIGLSKYYINNEEHIDTESECKDMPLSMINNNNTKETKNLLPPCNTYSVR